MLKPLGALAFAALALCLAGEAHAQAPTQTLHAISIHGTPKYGSDFKQLDYVNPDAPRGGEVILGAPGTYDSLNPFILKGVPAAGAGSIYDSLMTRSGDDPESDYGLVAESIEVPDDRSWALFTLRPEARFHDGTPITAADVVWTLETLKSKGSPHYRSYYADVDKAEALDDRRVKYTFNVANNRELPGIVGELPILPRHYWQSRDFEKTTLEPPLGSGPYRIEAVDPGRSIRLRRVEDYWGNRLPINVGRYNFGLLRYEYYRDPSIAFEAFKAGAIDFRREVSSKDWATGYDLPAARAGLILRDHVRTLNPNRPQVLVFNTRRPLFQDRRVRQALGYAFDFEWMNKNLFYGIYGRPASYWPNSGLAATGLPQDEELAILERYRGRVPEEVFTREFKLPTTDGSGNLRDNVREALKLLGEAGWLIKNGKLTNTKGEAFQFEILYAQPGLDRIILPFAKNLERLGVTASVRLVDVAQFENRTDAFDYDMIIGGPAQSASPGNEQRDFWSSTAADTRGSRNESGVKDPVVDELIDLVIAAGDRKSLVQRTHALDRVLLWGFYMIPQLYDPTTRIAYWDKFGRPPTAPAYGIGFADTWWVDAAKAASLAERKAAVKN
ncbi:MAG: ABC transporter substrate-binding protein [Proteobacteria bacterium]|nr:ABC transporter substrate-binding protein [Pseudomonadota bacterium]MBI3496443.1 ABC transporter substrate-binding protein [Pseudomonadota bacterium]